MSYFEILLLALLVIYLAAGLIVFLIGTRRQARFSGSYFVTRRSARRVVAKGEPFDVTLHARGEGQASEDVKPSRIVLVVDRSHSMLSEDTPGTPLHMAVRSVVEFAQQFDLTHNQIGVVQFDNAAETLCELTSSRLLIEAAARRITSGGGTDALTGIEEAVGLLGKKTAAPDTCDTVVLLTDGETERAQELADFCKTLKRDLGIRIVAVGLGPDIDTSKCWKEDADLHLLEEIASPCREADTGTALARREFYHVLEITDLVNLFRTLAHHIEDSTGNSGTLQETITRRIFQYTKFDDRHRPTDDRTAITTATARWILLVIKAEPEAIRYRIKGNRVGWHRIAAESAGFDFYSLPGPVHHQYQPGLTECREVQGCQEIHDHRCCSNRSPRILVTPRFGPPVIWAALLNPLFWICFSTINSLFRRKLRKAAAPPEIQVPTPTSRGPRSEDLQITPALQPPSFRPTLVLGLGKSGRHVLSAYKAMIADANGGEFPSDAIRLLQVDTDVRSDVNQYDFAGTTLDADEIADLSTDVFDLHECILSGGEPSLRWYLASRLAGLPREVFNTAGGVHRVRQIARLALFAHLRKPDSSIRCRLQDAVKFLAKNLEKGEAAQVLVAASSTGGTGSAIAHDLVYLIKRALYQRLPEGREHAPVAAFFLGTTCFAPQLRDLTTHRENARALLTEVDRLLTNSDLPLGMDYGVTLEDILSDGTAEPASKRVDHSGVAETTGSVYDQVYVLDPEPGSYADNAGIGAAATAEDSHYPALADLLAHYSIADQEFQEFIAEHVSQVTAGRVQANQRGHISNVYLRSVRFPVKLMTGWLGWRFVRDWFIGRTLWVESSNGGFSPIESRSDGTVHRELLLRHSATSPFLFDSLEEGLGLELSSGWDSVWANAFRSIQAAEGHDRGTDFVRHQTRIALLTLLDWCQHSLNGSGGDTVDDLDGAFPKTLEGLTELRELVEQAILNLSRLPIDTLSDVGAEAFPQWKANVLQELLDSYYRVVDSCVRSLDRWRKCFLGVSADNETQNELGVCQRINTYLRSCESNLASLGAIRSVSFQVDTDLRESLFEKYLEGYLKDRGFRSRLAWRLDSQTLKKLDDRLTTGASAGGVDRLLAGVFRLVVQIHDQEPTVEFSDPIKDADEICQALFSVVGRLHNTDEYCRLFAASNRVGHPFDRDLIRQARAIGGTGPVRERVVVNASGHGDAAPGAAATTKSIYSMPFVRAEVDLEVGIPIDQSVSWDSEAIPDEANFVFLEEQFSTVLRRLIAEQLNVRYGDFSPRLRQYFNHFDRFQKFLYLCLCGNVRRTVISTGQELIAWHHDGQTDYLTAQRLSLLEAMNCFIGREFGINSNLDDFCQARQKLQIDRKAFCQAIGKGRWNEVPGWTEMPSPMPEELELVLRLVQEAGGCLNLQL